VAERRRLRPALRLLGAAAVAAAGAPAIVSAQARKGVPSDPVKIGVLAIRAGIAAPVGTAGLRGTEWWAERVNKAGGILGRKVQLVVEEESNPKDTVERYRKLGQNTARKVIALYRKRVDLRAQKSACGAREQARETVQSSAKSLQRSAALNMAARTRVTA